MKLVHSRSSRLNINLSVMDKVKGSVTSRAFDQISGSPLQVSLLTRVTGNITRNLKWSRYHISGYYIL